jgi:hypothetical protein
VRSDKSRPACDQYVHSKSPILVLRYQTSGISF